MGCGEIIRISGLPAIEDSLSSAPSALICPWEAIVLRFLWAEALDWPVDVPASAHDMPVEMSLVLADLWGCPSLNNQRLSQWHFRKHHSPFQNSQLLTRLWIGATNTAAVYKASEHTLSSVGVSALSGCHYEEALDKCNRVCSWLC